MREKFEKFLEEFNIKKDFDNNVKSAGFSGKVCMSDLFGSEAGGYVLGAFSWANTPEGHEFWAEIDRAWRDCLSGTL